MRLTALRIRNYKSIPPAGISLDLSSRTTVLVGKNNAGKSNIIDAIGLLFGSKNPAYVRLPPEAFNDPHLPIDIEADLVEATYGDGLAVGLSQNQCFGLTPKAKDGTPKPGHGSIALRLRIVPDTDPSDEDHEADSKDATADPSPADAVPSDDESPEQEMPATKTSFSITVGPKTNVFRKSDQIRKALVRHILVPPLRSHDDVLAPSTWTYYGRFLRDILSDSEKTVALKELIDTATTAMKELLQEEADVLSNTAQCTAYVDSVGFQLTKQGDPTELLRNLSLTVSYAGRTEDISSAGTGTQSAVIIGVLELCLRHRHRGGIRLFVVEEPELFLHPHAQRYVSKLLRRIASEPGTHVVLTSHSASILSDTDVRNVVHVSRSDSGVTTCASLPSTYDSIDQSERLLTSETSEMLFSDRVVLVEGPSERLLLPQIAAVSKDSAGQAIDFDQRNVAVVPVGSKTSFRQYTDLLDTFGIQWKIVTDLDALNGSELSTYRQKAGITDSMTESDKRTRLAGIGVAVLSKGELEDCYPIPALAALAGCSVSEVPAKIDEARQFFDKPTVVQVLRRFLATDTTPIKEAGGVQQEKLLAHFYHESLASLRKEGVATRRQHKTGEALRRWLELSKPAIAVAVGRWLVAHPHEVPPELSGLVEWLVRGLRCPTPKTKAPAGKKKAKP